MSALITRESEAVLIFTGAIRNPEPEERKGVGVITMWL
jgi:hypothetical protein